MGKYVSIDIETLGLNGKIVDIVEFGAVIDDYKTPLKDLPTFHCYITKPNNIYKGDIFAMYMHSKSQIFERIANRDPNYSYIPADMLDETFSEWLADQGITEKIVAAGKNISGFDIPFLKETTGFGTYTKLHHRALDPGSMYFDPNIDNEPPGLEECLRRAGIEKTVEHTAVEDAMDVIKCIRKKYGFEI